MSMQSTLRAIVESKPEEIHTVSERDLVFDVVEKMERLSIGAIVVMNDEDNVVGIFSERDLLTRVVAKGLDPKATKVSKVMTLDPECVKPSMTVEKAMRKVTEERIRHLLLITKDKLEGLISSGDLTAWALKAREAEVEGLTQKLKRHKVLIAVFIGLVVLTIIGIAFI